MTIRRTVAVILIIGGLGLIGTVAYLNFARTQQPIFSNNTMLTALWNQYKDSYLEEGSGRTLDKERDNLTTSEGESYTMLRAVWQDDRATFDQSLKFTNENLRRTDGLFAWQFGKRADGSYGVLADQGGNNTASDADADIAMALIFASQRWQDQKYLDQARGVVSAIWENEVITVDGKTLLVANNLEKDKAATDAVIVNPSYFAPANFRIFARIDDAHDWNGLADNVYVWNERINTAAKLGESAGLPPDWATVNRATGEIDVPSQANLSTQYGYEAMRLPLRFALDYEWNKTAAAKTALERMKFLGDQFAANGKLAATYSHDGKQPADYEASGAIYGGSSGYFKVATSPEEYTKFYDAKLKTLYNTDTQDWRGDLSYYDDNWAWFGLALHENALIDLSQK